MFVWWFWLIDRTISKGDLRLLVLNLHHLEICFSRYACLDFAMFYNYVLIKQRNLLLLANGKGHP